MKATIVTVVVATAMSTTSLDVVAAESTLDRFQATYRALQSIRFSFEGAGVKGSVIAHAKGKYKITAGERTFVCNTNAVWNIDARAKTVVINTYDATSDDANLPRLFFTVLGAYRPTLVRDFGDRTNAIIRLTAPSNESMIGTLRTIEAEITRDQKIVTLTVHDGATTTWKLSKMQFNPPTNASSFSLPDTKGYTVVDLR